MIDAKRVHEVWEEDYVPRFGMLLDDWLLAEVVPIYNPGHTTEVNLSEDLKKYSFTSVLETLRKRGFKCAGWSTTHTINFDFS